ncbi:MAG: hypothetical protein DRQ37_04715 [Gammaproteobacteria bacterium]|nr:MAG: hypothetical protein DRQ37_04715 [Gammaproteobacteria bacterium]
MGTLTVCGEIVAQLHQIQIRYSSLEDRLMLRINTQDGAEFRFWLTRRYVRLLWPTLRKLLETDENVRRQGDSHSRQAVLSFQHEQALGRSDFDTDFEEGENERPLGDSPVLLARLQIRDNDGEHLLAMHPQQGQGVELSMNPMLLHSFCKLLADGAEKAGWDLGMQLTEAVAEDHVRPSSLN